MKLSMWIIANNLEVFDPEIRIREDSPRVLRSARRFHATDCVYVSQEGSDCVLSWGSDEIRIPDLPAWEGVELVQSIFDAMFDWHSQITEAVARRDFQKLVDSCHMVFRSPVVLQDAGQRCLAASSRYGPADVDQEWFHLKTYGYSSYNAARQLSRLLSRHMDRNRLLRYPSSPENNLCGCVTAPILNNGLPSGSLTVIEKDRSFNPGHLQLLALLAELLVPVMNGEIASADNDSPFLQSLLEGKSVSAQNARQIYAHKHWETDHVYRVLICSFPHTAEEEWLRRNHFLSAALSAAFPEDLCGIYDNHLVILANETLLSGAQRQERLERYTREGDMRIAHSLSVPQIRHVPQLLQQARFALEFGQGQTPDRLILDFYDYAVDYLIRSSYSPERCLAACHPDVHALYRQDPVLWETLGVYLAQDRSVTRTIEKLFIHKNTLLYRLRRIEEIMTFSLGDAYTREYMRLSFRLLRLHTDSAAQS